MEVEVTEADLRVEAVEAMEVSVEAAGGKEVEEVRLFYCWLQFVFGCK
jgi:hypothetical protein